jgi:hypothetical protein
LWQILGDIFWLIASRIVFARSDCDLISLCLTLILMMLNASSIGFKKGEYFGRNLILICLSDPSLLKSCFHGRKVRRLQKGVYSASPKKSGALGQCPGYPVPDLFGKALYSRSIIAYSPWGVLGGVHL